jgi:hypothetical protein
MARLRDHLRERMAVLPLGGSPLLVGMGHRRLVGMVAPRRFLVRTSTERLGLGSSPLDLGVVDIPVLGVTNMEEGTNLGGKRRIQIQTGVWNVEFLCCCLLSVNDVSVIEFYYYFVVCNWEWPNVP